VVDRQNADIADVFTRASARFAKYATELKYTFKYKYRILY